MSFELIEHQGLIASDNEVSDSILNRFSEKGPFTIWFFGGETTRCLDILERLPSSGVRGELGSRLDDAADRVETELLNIDTQVLLNEKDRLAWSASLIADRSPYAGDLQLNTARFLVMYEILASGGRHVFVVGNGEIKKALQRTAIKNGLTVESIDSHPNQHDLFGGLRARVSALKLYLKHKQALAPLRKKTPVPWAALKSCDVLIVEWAGEQTFHSQKPNSRVKILARMPEILTKSGLKVGFIAYPLSWTQDFSKITQNACEAYDPVVMVDDCRSLTTILKGGLASWRMSLNLGKKVCAGGLDISPIFELERIKDINKTQSTMAHTLFEVGKKLAAHGVNPKTIVYPYEFQGWERALVQGIRKYLPKTRVVGYQHAPIALRYIGFYPPLSDIKFDRLPDQIILMGGWLYNIFKKKKVPSERMRIGGSLRFEQVLDDLKNKKSVQKMEYDKKILVTTSIKLDEAIDLVAKAAHMLRVVPEVEMIVNFHPVVDTHFRARVRAEIANVSKSDFARVKFSKAGVSDLIQTASVLIYNNSGAVFDAIFAGVSFIYVAVDGELSYDKIPDHLSCRVTGVSELTQMVHQVLSSEQSIEPDFSIGGCIGNVNEGIIVKAVMGP